MTMNSLTIFGFLVAGIVISAQAHYGNGWGSNSGHHGGHGGGNWNGRPDGPNGNNQDRIEERNKANTLAFYQAVFGDKNIDAADLYISADTYIQHNPDVADGLEPFKTALKGWFAGQPKEIVDVRNIGADGDLVWLHVRQVESGVVKSVIDVFRFNRQGKIVEHWDVIQEVPKTAANSHPMF